MSKTGTPVEPDGAWPDIFRDAVLLADPTTPYRGFPAKIGTPLRHAATGEAYVEIASGIPGREDGKQLRWYPTATAAVDAFHATFDQYAAGKRGTIHWREVPTLIEHRGQYCVVSRLVITDAPEVAG